MDVKELEKLVLSLQKQIVALNEWATSEISKRDKEIAILKAENTLLKEKLAKYESKRRNNSKNSSIPSSQDQKPTKSETEQDEVNGKPVNQYNGRKASDRPVGGQKGHKGKTLSKEEVKALIDSDKVLHDVVYHGYTANPEEYIVRYEVAIECSTRIIEHKFAHICLVPEEYMSDVVYDASVKGIASMLHAGHHIALDRVSSILSYITHGIIEPCKATISKFIKEFAIKSLPEYVAVLEKSLDPSVKYTDATYIMVNGIIAYIRNISTDTSVLYEFLPKKNLKSLSQTLVLPFCQCTLVHDHETALYNYGMDHGECNAHHLRYLRKTLEDTGHRWPVLLINFLVGWNQIKQEAIESGHTCLSKAEYAVMKEEFDTLLSLGETENEMLRGVDRKYFARLDEAKLLRRLRKHERNVLLFLYDFQVDFTNNLSERDLRLIKCHLKMSGGFRSQEGASLFCRFQTVYQTMRRIGVDILENLNKIFSRPAEKTDGFSACLPCFERL